MVPHQSVVAWPPAAENHRRSAPRPRPVVWSYAAIVLRSTAEPPTVIPLGPARGLETLIAEWRRAIIEHAGVPSTSSASGATSRAAGATLRRRVWDPLAAQLSGVTRVFIVPDAAINLVPFAALPSPGGRYLAETGPTVHYLSAERDIISAGASTTVVDGGLLALGNPSFSDGSSFAALRGRPPVLLATTAPPIGGHTYRGPPPACPPFHAFRFEPLPSTQMEANTIAKLWDELRVDAPRNGAAMVLTGGAATERALKESGPGRSILHLATHGFFLGDECAPALEGTRAAGRLVELKPRPPATAVADDVMARAVRAENPLMLSGLALAGANRRVVAGPDEDDGILTADEASSLNLSGVQWAVLSACDTGLGSIAAGEGVLGLRRAFQIAGVRTVIMSLWSVEDRATRQWMQALYEARLARHLDTADSVREASLAVLRDRRAKGLSTSPFYWAGFVAAGDWR